MDTNRRAKQHCKITLKGGETRESEEKMEGPAAH